MVKIVVVGFGFMGMTHTGNILKNPAARLSAIVDKNTKDIYKKLEEQTGNFATDSLAAKDLEEVKVYDDFEKCLEAEKPDACIISVHTKLHFEMAQLALESGVHTFVEKPFVLNVEEGERLIQLAQEKNRVLMVGHVVRFMPAYTSLKNWIDSATYGKLKFLSLSRFSGVPAWGQWIDRQKEFGSSGGALFDLVIHDIDFAQWVCGVPGEISSHNLPGKLSAHDYVAASWSYPGRELQVRIEGGNIFHTEYPFQARFSAQFENASVFYTSENPENIIVATNSQTALVSAGDANGGFFSEINYFISCVESGEKPVKSSPESALESIRICYRHISTD
jgi:predicted dehydrogenase